MSDEPANRTPPPPPPSGYGVKPSSPPPPAMPPTPPPGYGVSGPPPLSTPPPGYGVPGPPPLSTPPPGYGLRPSPQQPAPPRAANGYGPLARQESTRKGRSRWPFVGLTIVGLVVVSVGALYVLGLLPTGPSVCGYLTPLEVGSTLGGTWTVSSDRNQTCDYRRTDEYETLVLNLVPYVVRPTYLDDLTDVTVAGRHATIGNMNGSSLIVDIPDVNEQLGLHWVLAENTETNRQKVLAIASVAASRWQPRP